MKNISKTLFILGFLITSLNALAAVSVDADDVIAIKRAALDYIESQHNVKPEMMERALHKNLAKRTFWQSAQGDDYVMETSYDTMVRVAAGYNKNGDKFPATPKKEVTILDADERIASVKLIADDWVDYMHLVKSEKGQWKIVNVLWRYHDASKHSFMK